MQQRINPVLIELARKHNIKIIATNDAHFVEEEHGEAHDHLICLATNKDFADPNRMHYTKQEWLKSPEEMAAIFADLPEALENTMEVADKVEVYSIDSDPLMPVFPIPDSFGQEEDWHTRFTETDLFNEFTRNEKGEEVMNKEAADKEAWRLRKAVPHQVRGRLSGASGVARRKETLSVPARRRHSTGKDGRRSHQGSVKRRD